GFGLVSPASDSALTNQMTLASKTYKGAIFNVNKVFGRSGVEIGGVYGPGITEANAMAKIHTGPVLLDAAIVTGHAHGVKGAPDSSVRYSGARAGLYLDSKALTGTDNLRF